VIELLRFVHIPHVSKLVVAEEVAVLSQPQARFLVEAIRMAAEYLGNVLRKRAVHVNRQAGNFPLVP